MLRDRLVCGCKDQRLQCKLLAEADLKFDTAIKIAKAMETAEKDTKGLQGSHSQGVNVINGGKRNATGHGQKPLSVPRNIIVSLPLSITAVEPSTKLQTVNSVMLSVTIVKRKVIYPRFARAS